MDRSKFNVPKFVNDLSKDLGPFVTDYILFDDSRPFPTGIIEVDVKMAPAANVE